MAEDEVQSVQAPSRGAAARSKERVEVHDLHRRRQGYSSKIKTLKGILDPRETRYGPIWHTIFVLCCVLAASLDPLFFYIPIINDQKKCLGFDEKLKNTMLVLRSVMDLTYIIDIACQIFSGYSAYVSEGGGSLLPRSDEVIDWILGLIRSIRWWFIIIDLLCVLPIPQEFTKNLSPSKITRAAWVKGLFNFFLYILASHASGAFWYFFSVQRELACWHYACKGNSLCKKSNFFCHIRYEVVDDPIVDYLNRSCSLTPSSSFNFGVYTPALQSGIVNSKDFPKKFFYCFAWGLRNLSSFGSNLQTSPFFWESLFSAATTIMGLLLFIYLIGNLQTYLPLSARDSEKGRRKMRMKAPELGMWIDINEVPPYIMKELVDRFLAPSKKKPIKQSLRLPILKKVARGQEVTYKLIDKITNDHLKLVKFHEHKEIFREGDPLGQMLFVTRGSARAYSTAGAIPIELDRGDVYGETLLEWAFTAPSSPLPISHKTVKTNTKVEAFALEAGDLKKIATCLGSSRKLTLPSPTNVPKRRWTQVILRTRGGTRFKYRIERLDPPRSTDHST